MNLVELTLEKLRKARRSRAAHDRQLADAAKSAQRKIELVLDKVCAELPLKDRDSCVLLTDDEYTEYTRKHFALQLSVAASIMLNLANTEPDDPDSVEDF